MRIILTAIILSLSFNIYAQNAYQLVKASKSACRAILINRSTICTPNTVNAAYNAILSKSSQVDVQRVQNIIIMQSQIQQPKVYPYELYGGYNYLRACSKGMNDCTGWEHIRKGNGYNGVHHIVNKSVLEVIYKQTKKNNMFTYSEFVANAPSVFHPYHNDKRFEYVFHDGPRQMNIYRTHGMKWVLLDFFQQVNKINVKYNLPVYDDEFIRKSLLEAKFWADSWGLSW